MKRTIKYYHFSTFLVFALIIVLFFTNQAIPFIADKEYDENKKKAELPEFDINHLDDYPSKFEAYLSDNFSLRGYFLKTMGTINATIWKKSPKPDKLIIGNDGWLYNVDKEFDAYNGKRNFTQEQLNAVVNEFKYRKKVLDSMGIEMAIVINPTKYSVYPEYLPRFLINNYAVTATEQLLSAIRTKTDINIIYTKEFLLPQKKNYRLYLKGDNHWNTIGGYYAAKGILSNLKATKNITPIPFTDFCIDSVYDWTGNLAKMAADAELFSETKPLLKLCKNDAIEFTRHKYPVIKGFPYPWSYQKSYKSNNDSLPNALIIRDSFGGALMPYMKNMFHYSTFIFDSWHYKLNIDIIKKEKPDVVIFMALESLITNFYTYRITDINKK